MLRVTGVSSGSSSARLLSVPCWALYQFPPLCSSVDGHFVARFLQFCYRWRENRAPASSSGLRPPFWGLLFDTPTRDAVTGPSSRSPFGLLLRRDSPKAENSLEVEPLVSRVRGLVFSLVLLWHAELSYRRIDEAEAKNAP